MTEINTFRNEVQTAVTQIQDAMAELEAFMRCNEDRCLNLKDRHYDYFFDGFSVSIDFDSDLPYILFHNYEEDE